MTKPLRVALFTDADVFAGTEKHLLDLARGLKSRGVHVSVACPAISPVAASAACSGIPAIPVEKRDMPDTGAVGTLMRLLRSRELDIVHAHNGRTAFIAAVARTLAQRGSIIATQHFLAPAHLSRTGARGRLSHMAHRWVNRRMDHTIAISHASWHSMIYRQEAVPSKLSVIHNGIPVPDPAKLRAREAVRKELGIPCARKLIVCVARLEPEKDLATLVRAMKRIQTTEPQAICLIAGDGSEKAKLQATIDNLALGKSVKLLGFVRDTLSLIHASDLFVLPSLAEPFGLVLLEAMALSKPVVATCAGGPLEIVSEDETGFLCPPSDATAMSHAMLKLIRNPMRAEEMGRKGLARFLENFTVDQMVDATLTIYSRL